MRRLQVQRGLPPVARPLVLRRVQEPPALQPVRCCAAAESRRALLAWPREPQAPVQRPEPGARPAALQWARGVLRDAPAERREASERQAQRWARVLPGASAALREQRPAEPEVSDAAAGLRPVAAQQGAAARPQAARDAAEVRPRAAEAQDAPRVAAAGLQPAERAVPGAQREAQQPAARLSAAPWAALSDRPVQQPAARPARSRRKMRLRRG